MVPGDGRFAVGNLGGFLQVRTVQGLPLLQRDNHMSGFHGNRRLAVGAEDHLVTPQHLQTHGDLTAGRLVTAGQRREASTD